MKRKIAFLAYDRSAGLTFHFTDWLQALSREAGSEFAIIAITSDREQEPGLLERLKDARLAEVVQLQNSQLADVSVLADADLVHCHGFGQLSQVKKRLHSDGLSAATVQTVHSFGNGSWRRLFVVNAAPLMGLVPDVYHFLSSRSYSEFMTGNLTSGMNAGHVIFPLGCRLSTETDDAIPVEIEGWSIRPERRNDVLYLANFTRNKRHEWLVKALEPMLRDHQLRLWLCGAGPRMETTRRYIQKIGLTDRVILPGRIARSAVPWVLAHVNAALCVSRSETGPHAVMEPLAAGVPVVSTAVGAAAEWITDFSTGFLIGHGNAARDLREKLSILLSDSALAVRMGHTGREYARSFLTWETCAKNTLGLYERMVRARMGKKAA